MCDSRWPSIRPLPILVVIEGMGRVLFASPGPQWSLEWNTSLVTRRSILMRKPLTPAHLLFQIRGSRFCWIHPPESLCGTLDRVQEYLGPFANLDTTAWILKEGEWWQLRKSSYVWFCFSVRKSSRSTRTSPLLKVLASITAKSAGTDQVNAHLASRVIVHASFLFATTTPRENSTWHSQIIDILFAKRGWEQRERVRAMSNLPSRERILDPPC